MSFINSQNIVLDKNTNQEREFIIVTRINPLETKEIARINLRDNWKFKFLYKIVCLAPEKTIQEKFIEKDLIDLESEINSSSNILQKIHADILNPSQIEKILEAEKIKFIDLDFLPNYSSIINQNYLEDFKSNFEYLIHWRRPEDFSLEIEEKNSSNDYNYDSNKHHSYKYRSSTENFKENSDINFRIFNQYDPDPNEIVPGEIPDNHFVSALSAIAEKNDLFSKIFITKNYSKYGFYQLRLCFNGEWNIVTIDDFFPCKPQSEPLVSRSPGSELWVLILEKAMAKLYESYYNLVQLNVCDYLSLLTGLPTEYWDLKDLLVTMEKQMLFKKIKKMLEKYNLLVAVTKNETEGNSSIDDENTEGDSLLIPNMGYTLLKIENETKNHVMILRKIWYDDKRDEMIKRVEKENFNNKIEDREKGLLYFSKFFNILFPYI